MISLTINEIVSATKGILLNGHGETVINGISTDSRKIDGNDLFIPLIGENFNGHEFINSIYRDIKAVIVSQSKYVGEYHNLTVVKVDDTLKALQDIARYYLSKLDIRVVGVTGSTGKTSTKDLIYSVLRQKYKTLSNQGNFNNHIGLPLTIFSLESDHEVAVLEMGMSNLGEIDLLANITRPNYGVITNIGLSHIENLKTQQNIMNAKMEITNYFNNDSLLVVNGDDNFLKTVAAQNSDYKKYLVGLEDYNTIRAINIEEMGVNGSKFDILYKNKKYPFVVRVPGIHNIYNSLCAFAVATALDISIELIQKGISEYNGSRMRLNIISTDSDITIVNDAYNASPDSMKAALDVLKKIDNSRKIAVLGDMLEMGDFAEQGHYSVGQEAALTVDILITVGKNSRYIAKGAEDKGLEKSNIILCMNNDEAKSKLCDLLNKGDTVLVKGSRGMKMEEIVEYIQERS